MTDQYELEASFLDPAVQDDPFGLYAQMHERCPVYRLPETGLVMVTRYDDVRSMLLDTETFSSQPGSGAAGRESASAVAFQKHLAEHGWTKARTLQRTDPPVHTRYRKLLGRVFTTKRVQGMTPRIDGIVGELIDGFIDQGTCDWVSEFAHPMPGIFICEQIGLPASEVATFRRWPEAMLALAQRPLSVEEAIAEAAIEVEAQHYLAAEFDKRRVEPTNDLISALVHAHGDDEQPLTMEELQDLMHQLITGGFETTPAALATGMWLLTRYPDQQQLLRDQPELMRNFVEEMLRFDSPVAGLWRTATCPVALGDVEVDEGDSVMARYAAANRDAEQFTEPERFDITRENAAAHIAFGVGNHFCIGAALARQELVSSFTAMIERTTWIELAEPLDDQPHEFSFFLRPMKQLPLRFET